LSVKIALGEPLQSWLTGGYVCVHGQRRLGLATSASPATMLLSWPVAGFIGASG
jgi:hypothetical protein